MKDYGNQRGAGSLEKERSGKRQKRAMPACQRAGDDRLIRKFILNHRLGTFLSTIPRLRQLRQASHKKRERERERSGVIELIETYKKCEYKHGKGDNWLFVLSFSNSPKPVAERTRDAYREFATVGLPFSKNGVST